LLHASNEKKAYGDFDFQLEELTGTLLIFSSSTACAC
jgi:hypothetical protein